MESARLANLLDKIDQVKTIAIKPEAKLQPKENSGCEILQSQPAQLQQPGQIKEEVKASTAPTFSGWYEFLDGKSCKSYYHNYSTGETQWNRPEGVDITKAPPPAPLSKPTDEVPVERAYFGRGGNFSHSGSQSYWARLGREDDKAGRQLGVFMDLSTLEQNREEAKRMKEEAQRRSGTRGEVDWATYKNQKQAAKKRKAQSWLYED